MPGSRRVFTVFLASPSDLGEERDIAEDVADFVNKSVANRSGWQIDLRRWEDTPPSFGRPQDSINPLVDECDLFIGLLWKWWGLPTGVHSSGFEEEFERAKARRKSSGMPEIWLMFKDVDQNGMKDPGDHLKKVMAFRETQIRLNEVKFTTFKDSEDWKSKLQVWLVRHILEFASQHPELSLQQAIAAPAITPVGAGTADESTFLVLGSGLPSQVKRAASALQAATTDNMHDLFTRDSVLSEFEIARLFLISGTLIGRRYTSLVLGTHEINLLYKHRDELDAATDERIELLRSMIGTKGDVNPGWFWFQELGEDLIFEQLFKFAIDDVVDDVRMGAIDLLALSRLEIPQESWSLLPLHHESWGVRRSAFNYLAEMGDGRTIDLLNSFARDAEGSPEADDALDARFRILSRLTPDSAFEEEISKEDFLSPERLRILREIAINASEEVLLGGVESPREQMKKLCARELASRGRLPSEVAHRLIQDSSLSVRAIALGSLAENGVLSGPDLVRKVLKDPESDSQSSWPNLAGLLGGKKDEDVPDSDSVIVAFYSSQSVESALAAVDWYSVDGPLAYRALALNHFDAVSGTIHEDIADGFRRIKEESLRRYEDAHGTEATGRRRSVLEKFDGFAKDRFTEAALLGIAKNGLAGAADVAKPFLSHDTFYLRNAAVKVASKFGDPGCAGDLLRIAKDSYGEVQREAALGALHLSSHSLEAASELLKSDNKRLNEVAFHWMIGRDSNDLADVFKEFLHDENAGFRIQSLLWLFQRLQKSELEVILHAYMDTGVYYYDVVTWLDRLLYAPPNIRKAFERRLAREHVSSGDGA